MKTEENKEKEGYRNNRGYETRPMGCCGQVESGRIGIRTLAVWMGSRHTLWFGHFHIKDLVQRTILRHGLVKVQVMLAKSSFIDNESLGSVFTEAFCATGELTEQTENSPLSSL